MILEELQNKKATFLIEVYEIIPVLCERILEEVTDDSLDFGLQVDNRKAMQKLLVVREDLIDEPRELKDTLLDIRYHIIALGRTPTLGKDNKKFLIDLVIKLDDGIVSVLNITKMQTDDFSHWFKLVVLNADGKTSFNQLYSSYKKVARPIYCLNQKAFSSVLRELGCKLLITNVDGKTTRLYTGISMAKSRS